MKKILLVLVFILPLFAWSYAVDTPDVALVKQGNALYQQGRMDEAIVLYKKALTANPSNFFAYMNCGYAYAAKTDNKTALAYLKKAYSLQPETEIKQTIDRLESLDKNGPFKSDNPLKFSKKIGLNICTLNNGALYDLKSGLNTGLEAIYGYGGLFSFQAGLFYSQKGAKLKAVPDSYDNLDYIELPAAVKLSFTPLRELMASVYFGGSAGVRVSAKNRTSGNETDLSNTTGLFDCGLIGGIEATYPVLNLFWISADLRLTQGLLNIFTSPSAKSSNSVFTVFFGLVF